MKVEANAKVNLTLEVFGKRADGYHALRSVVMPISLSDTLDIEVTEDGEITSDTGYDDDLCVKAARILKSSVSSLPSSLGAVIRVTKRIPAGGGLGGGSADAAAVLRALNELWKVGLSHGELAEIGAQVGSDVPALVLVGPVIMEGRGEKVASIEQSEQSNNRTIHLVLVNPGVHSSTKEVYDALGERASRPFNGAANATAKMVSALQSGDLSQIAAALMNDLQAPAVKQHPEIADVLVSLRTSGVIGAMMSGSGSSVFGIVRDAVEAERISSEMNARGYKAWPVQTL